MGKRTYRMLLLIIGIVIGYFAKERIRSFFEETILLRESSNTLEVQKPGDQLVDRIRKISGLWRVIDKLQILTSDLYLSKKAREEERTTQTNGEIEKITETPIVTTEKNIREISKNEISDENNKQLMRKWEGRSAIRYKHFQSKIENGLPNPNSKSTSPQRKVSLNTFCDNKEIRNSTIVSLHPYNVAAEDEITGEQNYNYNSKPYSQYFTKTFHHKVSDSSIILQLSEDEVRKNYKSSTPPYSTYFFERSDDFSTAEQRHVTAKEDLTIVTSKSLKNIINQSLTSENTKTKTRTETIFGYQNTLVSSISPEVFSSTIYETHSDDRSDLDTTPSKGSMEDLLILTHSSLKNQTTNQENSEKRTGSNHLITKNRVTIDTDSLVSQENKTNTSDQKGLMLSTKGNYSIAHRESKNGKAITNSLIIKDHKTTSTEDRISLLSSTKSQYGQSQISGETGDDKMKIIHSSSNYINNNITSPGDIIVRSKDKSVSSFITEEKSSSPTFEEIFNDYSDIEQKGQTTNTNYKINLMSSAKENEPATKSKTKNGKNDVTNSLTSKDNITTSLSSKKNDFSEAYTEANNGYKVTNDTIITKYSIIGEDSKTSYTRDKENSMTSIRSESEAKAETKNDKLAVTNSLISEDSKTSSTMNKIILMTVTKGIIPTDVTKPTDSTIKYKNNIADTGYTIVKQKLISLFSGSLEISGNTNLEMNRSSSLIYETYFFDCVNTEHINETINTRDKTSLTPSMESFDPGANTKTNIDKTEVTNTFISGESKTTYTRHNRTTKGLTKDNIPENATNTTVSLNKYKTHHIANAQFAISSDKFSLFSVSPEFSGSTDQENNKTLSPTYETYFFDWSDTDQNSQATNKRDGISINIDTESNTETKNLGAHAETGDDKTPVTNSFVSEDSKTTNREDKGSLMASTFDIIPEKSSISSEISSNTDLENDITMSPNYKTYFFNFSDIDQRSQSTKTEDELISYTKASDLGTYGEPNNGKTIVGKYKNTISMLSEDNYHEAHNETKDGATTVANSLVSEDCRTTSTTMGTNSLVEENSNTSLKPSKKANDLEAYAVMEDEKTAVTNSLINEISKTTNTEYNISLMTSAKDIIPEGSSMRSGKSFFSASTKISENTELENETLSPLNETHSLDCSNSGHNNQATNTRDKRNFMTAKKHIFPEDVSFFSTSTETSSNTYLENDEPTSPVYETYFFDFINTEQNNRTETTADKISLEIDPGANGETKNDKTVVTNTFISEDSKTTNTGYRITMKTSTKDNIPENNTVSLIKYITNHTQITEDATISYEKSSYFSVSPELSASTDLENETTLSPLYETYFFDCLDIGQNSQITTRDKTSIISSTKDNDPEAKDETKSGKTVITGILDSETSLMPFTKGDDLEAENKTKNSATINTLNCEESNTSEMGSTMKHYLEERTETKNDATTVANSLITEGNETKSTTDKYGHGADISEISGSSDQDDDKYLSPIYETYFFNDSDTGQKGQTTATEDNITLMVDTTDSESKNDRTEVANSLIGEDSKTTITKDTISLMSSANDSEAATVAELMSGKRLVTNSLNSEDSKTTNKEDEGTLITSAKGNHFKGLSETKDGRTTVVSSFISNDSKTTINLSDSIIHDVINQTGETTPSVNIIPLYKTSGGNNISISLYDLLVSYNATHLWGEVALTLLVNSTSDQITLDYGGISVSFSSLHEAIASSLEKHPKSPENNRVDIKIMEYDKQTRRIIIKLMSNIKPAYSYILNLKFISILSPFERGATMTKYSTRSIAKQKQRRAWIIGTFLFPNFGKMVFPCIETPERRSVFHLRLNRNRSDQAVSNTMKVRTQMLSEDFTMDDFYQTPAIPISSFSFNILPKYDSLIVERTPTLAFWFPPHLRYPVELLVSIANHILDFFIEYFQYHLPIQQISVIVSEDLYCDPPASFATILISSKYLFEKCEMNYEHKENLYHFLAKQFCDLWIGNIVSFNSWNDYWIKEGFSIYMAHLATMDIYDDYDFSSFNMRIQQNAFRYHRLPFFDEIYKDELYTNSIMGNNTPSKGAFLLHMVYNILKPQPFQEAIRIFFKERALQSVSPDAFWNSFNNIQENFDVKEFINSWAFNYYPTLNVDYENDTIIVKKVQQSDSNNHYNLWWIPISYFNGNDIHFDYTITHWLKQEQIIRIKFHFNTWIIFNPQYSGFVRFNYSRQLWKMIISGLRKGTAKLPSSVKAQLLDDSFTLASESFLDYSIPMTMALYLKNEEEYAPWFVALKHFSFLAEVIVNYPEWQIFQRYMAGIMSHITLKLQIKTNPVVEKEIQGQLRKILMSWSCMNDLSNGCDKWALDKFLKWKDDSTYLSKNLIPTELRSIIYCMGAKLYDDETSKYLYSFSKTQNITSGEALRLLEGVTCTSNSMTFMEILNDMFDTSKPSFSFLRLKEFTLSLKQSRMNSLLSFQYIRGYWQMIYEQFHESNGILNAIIEGATYFLRTRQYYNEVLALRKSVPKRDYTTLASLDLAMDQIEFNMNWDIRNLDKFRKWLNFYNKTLA